MATEKLIDEEKLILIQFYKGNEAFWNSDNAYYKNKIKKSEIKEKLVQLFNYKLTLDVIEKTFHSLRSSMLREVKKINDGIVSKKPRKFYENMEFLKADISKEKEKTVFEIDEIEQLIDFYRNNPPLWNHNLNEYRDRILREALLEKRCDEFERKYLITDIKQQWHNLLTTFKREKQREESSKVSGSGTANIYVSNWEFYYSMEFVNITCNVDESSTTLDPVSSAIPPKKKSKNSIKDDEQTAKAELWKALATSINNGSSINSREARVGQTNLEDRAKLFGQMVADSLLQCDPKDWTLIKKKIMDLFFDYEQQKSNVLNSQSLFPTCSPLQQYNTASYQQQGSYTVMMPASNQMSYPFSPGNSSNYSNES